MRETRGSADSGETGRECTNAFWNDWDENAWSTRFGCFGRKWNSGPVWTWDIRDKKFRSTRFGRVRVKLKQLAFFGLGQGALKYATRGFRPKIGKLALFNFGTFGTGKCEVRGLGVSAEIGTTRTKSFGTLGTKFSDGPENGTASGISADRGTECTF
ncbi:hypothetical protein KI387_000259, partial [Taxus chinensis]